MEAHTMKYRQTLVLLYACFLICYYIFYPYSTPALQNNLTSQENTVRVVSYNIHFGMGSWGNPNISEISHFLSSIQADIICLQEVDKFSIRSLFTNQPEILNESLSMQMTYKETTPIISGETGNLILSKFPIISVENIPLPSLKYPRNIQKVIVQTPTGPIRVLNTHLGLSEDIRQKQIKVLSNVISKDPLPTILAGDFNTSNLLEFQDLFSFLKDPAIIMNKHRVYTFKNSKYNSRIDYLLMSKNFLIDSYDVPKIELSDHYPVVVDIRHR